MGFFESIRLAFGGNQELKHAIDRTLFGYNFEYTEYCPVSTFQTLLNYSNEQIINQVYKRYAAYQNSGYLPKPIHYSDNMSYDEICSFNSILDALRSVPNKVEYVRTNCPKNSEDVKRVVFAVHHIQRSSRYQGIHKVKQLQPSYHDFVFLKSTGLVAGNSPNVYDYEERKRDGIIATFEEEEPSLIPGSQAFDQKLLEQSPTNLRYIRPNNLSYEMCLSAVKGEEGSANWSCLEYVPEKYLSKEMCDIAVGSFYQALDFVPKEFVDDKMMISAIKQSGSAISYLPTERIPYEAWLIAISKYPYAYREVPDQFRTSELQDIMISSLYSEMPEHIRSLSIAHFGKDKYARIRGFAYYLVENLRDYEIKELNLDGFADSIENAYEKQEFIDQYTVLSSFLQIGVNKGSDALKVTE